MRVFYFNDPSTLPVGIVCLDVLIPLCAALALIHALKKGFRYVGLYLALAIAGILIEEASVNNGVAQTHCHADATIMVTKCSSLNSVLFYPAWMYVAFVSAQRMGLPWWAIPGGTALLQGLYGVPYEMQGPAFSWWRYTDQDIAQGALTERIWGMPLMASYFHPAMGFGSALAAAFTGYWKSPSVLKWIGLLVLTPVCALFVDGPTRIFQILNVQQQTSVPCCLFLVFVAPVLIANNRKERPSDKDPLLFYIPLIWHAFFLSAKFFLPATGPVPHSKEMMAVVTVTSVVSLALYYNVNMAAGSTGVDGEADKEKKD